MHKDTRFAERCRDGGGHVFILAGQSNMEGKAKVSLMDYQAAQPATRDVYAAYRKDGKWAERSDANLTEFYVRWAELCLGPDDEGDG